MNLSFHESPSLAAHARNKHAYASIHGQTGVRAERLGFAGARVAVELRAICCSRIVQPLILRARLRSAAGDQQASENGSHGLLPRLTKFSSYAPAGILEGALRRTVFPLVFGHGDFGAMGQIGLMGLTGASHSEDQQQNSEHRAILKSEAPIFFALWCQVLSPIVDGRRHAAVHA